jgi:hypothetical protein
MERLTKELILINGLVPKEVYSRIICVLDQACNEYEYMLAKCAHLEEQCAKLVRENTDMIVEMATRNSE